MSGIKVQYLGKGLTERVLVNFEEASKAFEKFARVSQFVYPQPKTLSAAFDVGSMVFIRVEGSPKLMEGYILYGVDSSENLVWLGEIIDSGD
jgi:hypothetical protein